MSSCTRHPSKESVGACVNCGKLVCVQCRVEYDDKTYCRPCADTLSFIKETPAGSQPVPVVTAAAAPVISETSGAKA